MSNKWLEYEQEKARINKQCEGNAELYEKRIRELVKRLKI